MAAHKHRCPATLTEALTIPALQPCCVARMLGLSYTCIMHDIRAGEVAKYGRIIRRRAHPGARPRYTVPQATFRAYYHSMTLRNGCSAITSTALST